MLHRVTPLEQQVQNGVLNLLRMMPHDVSWSFKVPVGSWVIVRPDREDATKSVRKQLEAAALAGFLKKSQIDWIQGAPTGVLDIALQLIGGTHAELEVKQPGKKPEPEQCRRIELVRAGGGFADFVDDVEDVQPLIAKWRKQR